ncbi:TetR family transcriptional regulator [Sansalvadorimonas verongulae]|uniref:TetR family transcriptional regulator n=1 Tax=Sansalvadorimonas verongulae TaxID=2172824 RepID=UPI0012BD49E1|nr:TetR family transcriptional regulator [Sansalvadorimonas verongulae]MTI12289.1 TetR family transcriptional regulator [Sansalvadorimonas verongulae]
MARKTKEDAKKTRQQLLASALRLFSENGLARVTLADIARDAGATRGAIYWHFKDKEALLNCLWDEAIAPSEKTFDNLVALGSDNPLDDLARLVEQLLVQIATQPRTRQIFRMMEQSLYMGTRDKNHNIEDLRYQWQEALTSFLEPVERQGELRTGLTAKMAALLIGGSIDGLISHHLADENCIDLKSNAALLASTFTDMVRKS